MGTFFLPLAQSLPGNSFISLLMLTHLTLFALVVAWSWGALCSLKTNLGAPCTLVVGALFATSPNLGGLAFDTAFPDGFITVSLAALFSLPARTQPWVRAIALIGLGGIHELAILLATMPMSFSLVLKRRPMIAEAGPPLLGLVVSLFHVSAAPPPSAALLDAVGSSRLIAEMPELKQPAIDGLRETPSQGLASAMGNMAGNWERNPLNGVVGIVYATVPSVAILLLGLPLVRSFRDKGGKFLVYTLYVASALSPLATLLVAYDLSRLASYTTFSALLTIKIAADAARDGPTGAV